jgi:hypothetical protein
MFTERGFFGFRSLSQGNTTYMDFRRVFRKRARVRSEGVDAASDVNVTVAANVGRPGTVTRVSSRQRATATASSSASSPSSEGSEARSNERENEGTEDPPPDDDRRR